MRIEDASFIVVDTESTGLDASKDQLVEIAAVVTSLHSSNLGMWGSLVRPTITIPPETSAIHGLTDADVFTAPDLATVFDELAAFVSRYGAQPVFAAHNAQHDAAFLQLDRQPGLPYMPFVCTRRLSEHIWPSAPNHKNQTLRFWRGLKVETMGIAAHRGLGDALVTAALLRDELTCDEFRALNITDVAALIEFIESPIVFQTFPFGQYRGKPISAAPADYVSWCLRKMPDLSRDMRFTLELQLKGAA